MQTFIFSTFATGKYCIDVCMEMCLLRLQMRIDRAYSKLKRIEALKTSVERRVTSPPPGNSSSQAECPSVLLCDTSAS